MAELPAKIVRESIMSGRNYCVKELAQIAIDQQYQGFEDPRSAAGWILGQEVSGCRAKNCDVTVKVSKYQETAKITGKCLIENACLSELWDKESGGKGLQQQIDDIGLRVASSQILSYTCPHFACEFHCGYTIDGGSGKGGECMKLEPTETPVTVATNDMNVK